MAGDIENRLLTHLGCRRLPSIPKLPPGVSISFERVRIRGKRAFVSGHGPLAPDGTPTRPFGKVPSEVPLEAAQRSARLTGIGGDRRPEERDRGPRSHRRLGDRAAASLNADPSYTQTTLVLNPFSDLMIDVFGPDIGAHARTAIRRRSSPAQPATRRLGRGRAVVETRTRLLARHGERLEEPAIEDALARCYPRGSRTPGSTAGSGPNCDPSVMRISKWRTGRPARRGAFGAASRSLRRCTCWRCTSRRQARRCRACNGRHGRSPARSRAAPDGRSRRSTRTHPTQLERSPLLGAEVVLNTLHPALSSAGGLSTAASTDNHARRRKQLGRRSRRTVGNARPSESSPPSEPAVYDAAGRDCSRRSRTRPRGVFDERPAGGRGPWHSSRRRSRLLA